MEFLPGRPDVHGSDQSRGRKYSLSFTSCHGTLFLLSLSDVCTILGLTLFSVARPPSFLEQGTIIWHLTPGSEWLNGWFLAVSAVTSSVRDFVLNALPKIHLLSRTATSQSYAYA